MISHAHDLCIHPELSHPKHERGVFEIEGHPGGWREWLAYDSQGIIRLQVGKQARDANGFEAERMEIELTRLEDRDREEEEA